MMFPRIEQNTLIQKASDLIREASYCVALSGAGISTSSGIPDFRSPGSGIWTKYSPMEVASLSAFRYHPDRFYDWLRPFVGNIYDADPNPAHLALARLEQHNFLKAVITQNIDALHQKAGSKNVIEVHGTWQTLTCLGCYRQVETSQEIMLALLDHTQIPHCSYCGKLLKPDIILYEEQLPVEKWRSARQEILACDLLLILGSSLTVTPSCDLPFTALGRGAKIIIINYSHTHLDDQAAVSLQGDLAELMPLITAKVLHEKE
jgi:NAD-dependent deacetylase